MVQLERQNIQKGLITLTGFKWNVKKYNVKSLFNSKKAGKLREVVQKKSEDEKIKIEHW
jgi:hypothetical protein